MFLKVKLYYASNKITLKISNIKQTSLCSLVPFIFVHDRIFHWASKVVHGEITFYMNKDKYTTLYVLICKREYNQVLQRRGLSLKNKVLILLFSFILYFKLWEFFSLFSFTLYTCDCVILQHNGIYSSSTVYIHLFCKAFLSLG